MGPVYILYSNLFHPSQQEILSMWAHMSVGSKIVYSPCFHLVNYLTNLISHSLIFLLVFFLKKKNRFHYCLGCSLLFYVAEVTLEFLIFLPLHPTCCYMYM